MNFQKQHAPVKGQFECFHAALSFFIYFSEHKAVRPERWTHFIGYESLFKPGWSEMNVYFVKLQKTHSFKSGGFHVGYITLHHLKPSSTRTQ